MHSLALDQLITFCFLTAVAYAAGRVCDADILSGRDLDNQFSNPPPSCAPGNYTGINTYPVGTPLTVAWTCSVSPVDLAIVQEKAAQPILRLARNVTGSDYAWNGFPPQPLSNGNIFFFELFDPNDNSRALFASDYINIAGTDSSSSSSMATTAATVTATSTLLASATTTSPPTSTSSSSTVNNSDAPSNTSTAIGAGVGGGVGGALVIATGAVLLYWRHRRKNTEIGIDRVGRSSKHTSETTGRHFDAHPPSDANFGLPRYERQELDASGEHHGLHTHELLS